MQPITHEEEEDEADMPLESKISRTLSERTTKIVIILVLLMLFFQPVFSVETYQQIPCATDQGLKHLVDLYNSQGNWTYFQLTVGQFIASLKDDGSYPLIYLKAPNISSPVFNNDSVIWQQAPSLEVLRNDDYGASLATAFNNHEFVAFYNQRRTNKLMSILSIARTVFICAILSIASIFFTNDANRLVLGPIERMLEKVKLIARNPLAAASDEVDQAGVLSMLANQQQQGKNNNEEQQFETALLEKAIVKIGHLLALGFGEAGSKIIASNISHGGDINPMMAGQRVYAIFGFCDIRNFTDSTEILQTKVMLFVNQIAEITHSMVDKHGGSANKNIGDAFLLVWKFKKEQEFFAGGKISRVNQQVADLALFSFVKIIAKINKYTHILDYRKDPGLNERMPDYKVKMGFGLHQGWAIEGAIGSMFKIDASYLSPNVNMASRLEAATK